MKQKTYDLKHMFLLFVVSGSLFAVLLISPYCIGEEVVKTNGPANPQIATIIEDFAVCKLLILGSVYKFIGLSEEDREKLNVGLKAREKTIDKILSKYNKDMTYFRFIFSFMQMDDLPLPITAETTSGRPGITISLPLPSTWVAIIPVRAEARLPSVKFKEGRITLNLQSMKATFADKTEAMADGKQYIYLNGEWFENAQKRH